MSQGESTRKNASDASATPPTDGNPRRYLSLQIHRPQNGRNASIVGLESAPTPYSAPNRIQPRQPGQSCNSRASRKMHARTSGVNVVSQIQWMDQYHT